MNRGRTTLGLISLLCFSTLACTPKEQSKSKKSLSEHPVGTGPFIFRHWQRTQKLVLQANPNYWGGKPDFDSLIMVPVKENTTRQLKLENGDIQVLDGISPRSAKELASRDDVTLIRRPGMNIGYLAFNTEKAPFNNPKVRQAISLVINKEKIVELNFQGFGQVASQVVPKAIADFQWPAQSGPNLEKAKQLLKESGVKLPLQTELWHMPNPRPYMPEPQKMALLIREDLAKIGIEANLVKKTWSFYLRETKAGVQPLCLLGWTADVADPDNFLNVFFASENIGQTNISRYQNKTVDELLKKAEADVDQSKRLQLYRQIEEIIRQDCPIVPLVSADQLKATRKDTTGFEVHSTGRMDFAKIKSPRKVVVFARGGEASKLDPALIDDGESVVVCRAVYEPLVRYARDSLTIEPCLATSWTKSENGKNWFFELRKGVKFHDGTDFDAEAVCVNFQRILDANNRNSSKLILNRNLYRCIDKVVAKSKYQVEFQLHNASATFLTNLTIYTAHIVSPRALKSTKK